MRIKIRLLAVIFAAFSAIGTSLIISCGGGASLSNMSARELFTRGMDKYAHKKYLRSIDLFQAIIYNYPGEECVDTAQYYLGMSYFGNDEYQLAAVEFNRLALNYPSSEFFDDAVFMRGVSYYKSTPENYGLDQGDLDKAIEYLNDFIIDFPESERAEDARILLNKAETRMAHKYYESGVVYSRIGGYDAAKIYFQKVIDDYTDTKYAALATFKLGEMRMKTKDYVGAMEAFEKFTVVFRDHELAPKAREKQREATFKAGKYAFEKQEYDRARDLLMQFQKEYPKSDNAEKAAKMLKNIPETGSSDTVEVSDAGS